MENQGQWMNQFLPGGRNKIQHDKVRKNTFDFIHWQHTSHPRFAAPLPCQLRVTFKSLGQLHQKHLIHTKWGAEQQPHALSAQTDARTVPPVVFWCHISPPVHSKGLRHKGEGTHDWLQYLKYGYLNGLKVTVSQGASYVLQDLKAQDWTALLIALFYGIFLGHRIMMRSTELICDSSP